MSTREFIHHSLYHPTYGYFSKQAQVFTLDEPIEFNKIKNNDGFMKHLASLYEIQEQNQESKQIWHTPTEIFQPWYGNALANYILTQYKSDNKGNEYLDIYEIGAGNGTLMSNILDYIRMTEPQIYTKTRYNIIEISHQLSKRQYKQAEKTNHKVQIINKSIFDWSDAVPQPCFFIAMEVLDNLSHDLVRYDSQTLEPLQGMVLIDDTGDYEQVYQPVIDPLLSRYLETRARTTYQNPIFSWKNKLKNSLNPLQGNMTDMEYIPTNAFRLLEILNTCFSNHRLLISDFSYLPDTIPGINAPVVQTRYKKTMVPCSTYLVQPGWFDIFFPTDFGLLNELYGLTNGKVGMVKSHGEFLQMYAQVEGTRTIENENPMLSFYENVQFFTS
ncbi:S-adenosyl-L-methionine-dependent methyltransferase [Globomyces pollinis-pini]|nr:S-adenosyl-L-methionine-dependent methyltransferase [Globomyces pollinis-pini]